MILKRHLELVATLKKYDSRYKVIPGFGKGYGVYDFYLCHFYDSFKTHKECEDVIVTLEDEKRTSY